MSREIPYQPMGRKVVNTTPEQMFAKLEARNAQIREKVGETAKQDSDELKTTRPDQQGPPGLVWTQPQKGLGFVYIDSGPYRITREKRKYDCHRESYYLGTCNSADEAKQLCERHAATQAQSVTP